MKPTQLSNQCLTKRYDGKGVFNCRRHIADAKFNSIVNWVKANIPPDLLAILDKTRIYQCLYVVL